MWVISMGKTESPKNISRKASPWISKTDACSYIHVSLEELQDLLDRGEMKAVERSRRREERKRKDQDKGPGMGGGGDV